MTRIAIQFFGHLRTFEKCLPALKKHLLNRYDCDIFMHTWDTYNHNTKTWHNNFRGATKSVSKDKIKKLLKITDEQIVIEHQKNIDSGKFMANGVEFSLHGLKSVQHSIKTVNELREKYQKKHKIKYDCVVCIRPDILLMSPLNLDKYISAKDYKNNIYYGGAVSHDIKSLNGVGGCDLLFFGCPENMSKLCINLKTLVKNGSNIDYVPEGQLIDNIYKSGLVGVFLGSYYCNKQFEILRPKQIKFSSFISMPIDKYGVHLKILHVLPNIFSAKIKIFSYEIGVSLGEKK